MYLKKLDEHKNIKIAKKHTWTKNRLEIVFSCIKKQFPDGSFNFVDLGGGDGFFTDIVLETFPKCSGILLDNSEYLISLNQHNLRKTIICDSIENVQIYVKNTDVVFCNYVLHHLVSNSYIATRKNFVKVLTIAASLISERGSISIFEPLYDGIYFDNLPSHLIFALTSSKLLSPVISKMGANTAGCGVCFLSKRKWEEVIAATGLNILSFTDEKPWNVPLYRKILLHMGNIREGHYWVNNGITSCPK